MDFKLAPFIQRLQPTKADIVWVIMLSMLFNALLPLSANALPGQTSIERSGQILMCTSRGYQWVAVNSLVDSKINTAHCLACLSIDNDISDPGSSDSVHVLSTTHQLQATTALVDFPTAFSNPPPARAPPKNSLS